MPEEAPLVGRQLLNVFTLTSANGNTLVLSKYSDGSVEHGLVGSGAAKWTSSTQDGSTFGQDLMDDIQGNLFTGPEWENPNPGGNGGGGSWGSITGTLTDQTDLAEALASKRSKSEQVPASEIETSSTSRFISDAELTKLAGIAEGAQVNQSISSIANALDVFLGTDEWRTGGTQPTETAGGDACLAILYNSVNSGTITQGSSGNVNYDTIRYLREAGKVSTTSDGVITINDTGKFKITAKASHQTTTINTKNLTYYKLQTDASGSWADVPGAADTASEAGSSGTADLQNEDGFIIGFLELTVPGKKIQVVASPVNTNGDIYFIGSACQLTIDKLEAGIVVVAQGGGGGASPITFYDETTSLGTQTAVKFTGSGVTASIGTGGELEVNVPAQATAAAGNAGTVQFNGPGGMTGAAGVKILSPVNGLGFVNHILHADTFSGGLHVEDVNAGGSFWPDNRHSAAYQLNLQGNATIKGSALVKDEASSIALTRLYLVNTTSGNISVTFDTSTNQFNKLIGVSSPLTLAAYETRIVGISIRKDAAGNVTKAIEA